MPQSLASGAGGDSTVASSCKFDTLARQDKRGYSDERHGEEDDSAGWEQSQGFWGIVYGATYLAQTPRDQALSFKTGMASSLIQSTELLFLLLNTHAGLFAPDRNLWVYKYFSWVLLKLPLLEYTHQSYKTFMAAVYLLLAALLIVVGLFYWISSCIKNDEHERRKYKKVLGILRPLAGLLFLVFPVAIMDLCATVFMCTWEDWPNAVPRLWPEAGQCLEGAHLVHILVAACTFLLYAFVSTLMGVGTCEQNPACKHVAGSPNLTVRFQITAIIKPLYVLAATQLVSAHNWQCGLTLVLTMWAFWMNLRQAPYYIVKTCRLHCGLWLGCSYIACLGLVAATWFEQGQDEQTVRLKLTWWAGVGVMPAGIFGIILGQLRPKLFKRQLRRIAAAPVGAKPHKVIRLQGRWHVEVLSRCVRDGYDEKLGIFDQNSIELAETVLSYGVAKYGKEDPFMVTLQASFSVFVYNNIQKARMQLQSVKRDDINVLEAYGQYCCGEYIKALKDNAEGGMDLTSYLEFAQHYRAATRAHRSALQAQRDFWRALLTDIVDYSDLESILKAIDKAEHTAVQVYRRVVERYPNNAKLLRAYARFTEQVQHDPWRANKLYRNAESLDSSDSSMKLGSMIKAVKESSSGGLELDESKDGIVIINTAGVMMTINEVFCSMFGYSRLEMEGRDVAMIIPPPYNQRHTGYIQRYVATGEKRIMDLSRRVIGLHKDKYMIPVSIYIQHLSGTGPDSMFLGILKPIPSDPDVVEVWAAPQTGVVLCVDPRFQDHYGFNGHEVTGKKLSTRLLDPTELDMAVLQVSQATRSARNTGDSTNCNAVVRFAAAMKHKYLDPVDVHITVESVGSPAMPWLQFRLERSRAPLPMAVFDQRLSILMVSPTFASLISYPSKQLIGMQLSDIIPAPWSQLHSQWVKGMPAKPPRQSCRSGVCVNLLSKINVQVPVKLSVVSKDDAEGGKHIVQVQQSYNRELVSKQQHLLMSVDRTSGCIVEVAQGSQAVFGWDPELVIGKQLSEVVDAFQMWEANNGPGSATLLLQSLETSVGINPGESWRVGVQPTMKSEAAADKQDSTRSWENVLKNIRGECNRQLRPARLQVVLDIDEAEGWYEYNRMSIALWRADVLSGVLEVDEAMRVLKADELAGIILGQGSGSIVKHSLNRYFPDLPSGNALLASGPKGSIKKKGPSWAVGQPLTLTGLHRDGMPLTASVQAVGMEGKNSQQMTLHIRPVTPVTACLKVFARVHAQASTGLGDGAAEKGDIEPINKATAAYNKSQDGYAATDIVDQPPPPQFNDNLNKVTEAVFAVVSGQRWAARQPAQVKRSHSSGEDDDDDGSEDELQKGAGHATAFVTVRGVQPAKFSAVAVDDSRDRHQAGQAPEYYYQRSRSGDGANSDNGMDTVMQGGSSATDLSGNVDLHSDARRAKRLRKLLGMLNSGTTQAPRNRFKQQTWLLLALLIVVHIICFILFSEEVDRQHRYIYEVEEMAHATDHASLMVAQGFTLAKCLLPQHASTVFFCEPSNLKDRVYNGLQMCVETMRRGHHGLFLGFDTLRALDPPNLYSMWADPITTESTYYDVATPVTVTTNNSLWMIGNTMIDAGAQLVHDAAPYVAAGTQWPDVFSSRHLQYLVDQGIGSVYDQYTRSLDKLVVRAYSKLSNLYKVLILLIVLEAFGIVLGILLYNWTLIRNMAHQHMMMFTAFLSMPSALIRSMAAQACLVDDEDACAVEDDDVELEQQLEANGKQSGGRDTSEAGKQVRVAAPESRNGCRGSPGKREIRSQKANATELGAQRRFPEWMRLMAGVWGKYAQRSFEVNGKQLLPGIKMELKSMSLFVLFQLLLVVIYVISFTQLSGLNAPLSQLNTAHHIVYRASRIRVFAIHLIFSQSQAEKQKWRANLERNCGQLEDEYNVMLYGGVIKTIGTTFASEFLVYSPPVVFNNRATADLFFSTRDCLRDDKSTCFKPDHKYYQVTHNGINAMMMRYIDECRLLQIDNDTDVNPQNSRYHYIYTVGGKDLYEATQRLALSITEHTIAAYNAVKTLHLVLLVLEIVLPMLYLIFVFRPLLSCTRKHTSRVAGLLSQLPPEVDVEVRLKAALNRHRQHDSPAHQGQEQEL